MNIRVGSRESKLAVVQAEIVMDFLRREDKILNISLVTMKTTGDIILDKTLDKIGGKGLFVKELDKALMDDRVDITVHSLKDMPMDVSEEIPLIAFSKREDPRDVLILPEGSKFLDESKPIGCSSKRRILQLKKLYPHMRFEPIRGNLQTRLKKLDEGQYSAIVLAMAGIKRLGLEHRISRIFSTEEVIPAACQAILAVQARRNFDRTILRNFNDRDSEIAALGERAFVRALDGGCSSPVAAYCRVSGDEFNLTGFFVDEDENTFKKTVCGHVDDVEEIGRKLAIEMRESERTKRGM